MNNEVLIPAFNILKRLTNPSPVWLQAYPVILIFVGISFSHWFIDFIVENVAFVLIGILICLIPYLSIAEKRAKQFEAELCSGDAICYYLTTKSDFIGLLKQDRIRRVIIFPLPFYSFELNSRKVVLAFEKFEELPIAVVNFEWQTLSYVKRLCKIRKILIQDENGHALFDPKAITLDPWDEKKSFKSIETKVDKEKC